MPLVLVPGAHVCGPVPTGLTIAGGNPMGREDPFWAELASSLLMRGWDAV